MVRPTLDDVYARFLRDEQVADIGDRSRWPRCSIPGICKPIRGDFAALVMSSVLLGAVFIAIGYVVSAVVRDRGMAGGMAVGIWLVFVLVYDMALLGGSSLIKAACSTKPP